MLGILVYISWLTPFPKDIGSGFNMQVSFVGPSIQTKCSFHMNAHENFVDLNKERFFNGPVADKWFEIRENEEGF